MFAEDIVARAGFSVCGGGVFHTCQKPINFHGNSVTLLPLNLPCPTDFAHWN